MHAGVLKGKNCVELREKKRVKMSWRHAAITLESFHSNSMSQMKSKIIFHPRAFLLNESHSQGRETLSKYMG